LILFGETSLRREVSNFMSTFIMNAIIRARTICSYSPPARLHLQLRSPQFVVTSGSVACSSTAAAPHEFFGHMRSNRAKDLGSEGRTNFKFVRHFVSKPTRKEGCD